MNHIPPGYHAVTPYLTVRGAARLLDFMRQAFDAVEVMRHARPDGTIMHAAVRIGDSMVEAAEANERWGATPGAIHLYVPDTDATYARAVTAGAESLMEPADMFYGERSAAVRDPAGNQWYIATRTEDVPPEELERRSAEFAKQQQEGG